MRKFIRCLTLLAIATSSASARSKQASDSRPNAALVLGGYIDGGGNPSFLDVTDKVELVGCEAAESASIEVTSLPARLAFAAGVFASLSKTGDGESVLVCGGLECGDESCDPSDRCHNFVIGETEWNTVLIGDIQFARLAHIMTLENGMPLIMPLGLPAEVLDTGLMVWRNQTEMTSFVSGYDCFVFDEEDNFYYMIREDVLRVTPVTGQTETLLDLSASNSLMGSPGKCAMAKINGVKGIFTRYGFWLNLDTLQWETLTPVPWHPWVQDGEMQTVMNTFRGAPAVFGGPSCDPNTGVCLRDKIQIYDVETDDWTDLGKLIYPRMFASVVEVPAEFCDTFVDPLTTTTTTTTKPSSAVAVSISHSVLIFVLVVALTRGEDPQ